MRLRDLLHAEQREENVRIHTARIAVWESEQPKDPICGWDALIDSIWNEHVNYVREKLEIYS